MYMEFTNVQLKFFDCKNMKLLKIVTLIAMKKLNAARATKKILQSVLHDITWLVEYKVLANHNKIIITENSNNIFFKI